MRLNQIRDFVAVVETGSISAAARSLGVSQPGITKSVGGLESELHAKLLQRTTRGVVLTPYGRAFFTRARVAQSELRKGAQEVEQLAGERAGSVAFGFGPHVAILIVPEAIPRFRQQFPRANVRLVEGLGHALIPLVRDEVLDFVVTVRFPGVRLDTAIAFRPLFRHRRVVVARKGHPLGNARSLAQLADATWLSLEPRELLNQTFSSAGLPLPRRIIQCESYNALVALLANSDMLAVVPRLTLTEPFAADLLQEMAVAEPMPSFTVGMFRRADTPLTPVAAAMAKAVTAAARPLSRLA